MTLVVLEMVAADGAFLQILDDVAAGHAGLLADDITNVLLDRLNHITSICRRSPFSHAWELQPKCKYKVM